MEHAALLEGGTEKVEIVEAEPQAAKDHDIRVRLEADAREQRIIGFPRDGKDGYLLALYQRVEDVDHGDVGADHARGDHAHDRVDRRTLHLDARVGCEGRPAVHGLPGAAEYPSQDIVRIGRLQRVA